MRCRGNESRSCDLREYVLMFCVLSCLTCENLFQRVNVHSVTQFNLQAEPPDNPLSMRRQKIKSVSTQQFLSFKCDHCKSEFETSTAYRTHRTHYAADGTPCSLEENGCELIHTERRDRATGNLQRIPLGSSKLGA